MPGPSDPYAASRLNLEQQRKRAKDLLRAVRAGDAAARRRLADPVALPADMPTLHVRCGSDIKGELEAARFSGDFLAVWDSFPVGPVTDAPDWIAQRARFHADTGSVRDVDYNAFFAELTDADRRLAASAKSYARVVIWTEHESHDQLSLIRCLAHYARTRRLTRFPKKSSDF